MSGKTRTWHEHSPAMELGHYSPTKDTGPGRDSEGGRRGKEGEGSADGLPRKLDKVADNTEEADLVRNLEISVFPTSVLDQGSV